MRHLLVLFALALGACTEPPTETGPAPATTGDLCTCVSADGVADEPCLTAALGDLEAGVCVSLRCELSDGTIWRQHACAPAAADRPERPRSRQPDGAADQTGGSDRDRTVLRSSRAQRERRRARS